MTGDLLVIVPAADRPQNIARLLDAVHATAGRRPTCMSPWTRTTRSCPSTRRSWTRPAVRVTCSRSGRARACAGTNDMAVRRAGEYPFLASLGDDMVPRTPGWDRALIRGIERHGRHRDRVPVGRRAGGHPRGGRHELGHRGRARLDVRAVLKHWYPDNVWADLGRGAGCLRHLRAIAVDHLNVAAQGSPTRPPVTTAGPWTPTGTPTGAWRREPDGR